MTVSPVEPPPEAFNFAAHLLEANAGRFAKAAFIDDIGVVTMANSTSALDGSLPRSGSEASSARSAR